MNRRAGMTAIVTGTAVSIGGIAPYCASKGVVRRMSKQDAIPYAAEKIRGDAIRPAFIWPALIENHLRATSPDLDAAKFATGAKIVIDGCGTAR